MVAAYYCNVTDENMTDRDVFRLTVGMNGMAVLHGDLKTIFGTHRRLTGYLLQFPYSLSLSTHLIYSSSTELRDRMSFVIPNRAVFIDNKTKAYFLLKYDHLLN